MFYHLYLKHLHIFLAHAECNKICRIVQTEFYISRFKSRVKESFIIEKPPLYKNKIVKKYLKNAPIIKGYVRNSSNIHITRFRMDIYPSSRQSRGQFLGNK